MDEQRGWVSIHRKLLENPIAEKPNYLSVWIFLLLSANHKDRHIIWNNKKTLVKRGSFIGSISKIAQQFNLSTGTVSNILDYFISEKMIEKSSNYRFSLFTILNYDIYQSEVESKTESKLKANRKQVETNNNDNNDNNENKRGEISLLKEKETWKELSEKFDVSTNYVKTECEKMIDWLKANGKRQKDYKAFARNWLRKGLESGGEAKVNSKKHEDYWKKRKQEEKKQYSNFDADNYYIEDTEGNKISFEDFQKV